MLLVYYFILVLSRVYLFAYYSLINIHSLVKRWPKYCIILDFLGKITPFKSRVSLVLKQGAKFRYAKVRTRVRTLELKVYFIKNQKDTSTSLLYAPQEPPL